MKIILTRALAGHAIGAMIERNRQVAEHLIAAGAATKAEPDNPPKQPSKATKGDATDAKGTRTRRSQRRTADDGQANATNATSDADKPAGQRGGGVPPTSPPQPAG